jgi:glutamate synthase (ferredoxin)
VSADGRTGDGAFFFDIPHDFLKKVCDFTIPKTSEYAVMVFTKKEKPS